MNKKRRNPWISIADLLSSVVLILVLLFVMAALGPKYSMEAQKNEMMSSMDTQLKEFTDKGLLKVVKESGVLEFTSITFDSGSAEINSDTKELIKVLSKTLVVYMNENEHMEILIEGHTDPALVGYVHNRGGYFENNIQLSTLRAANVRGVLLKYMGEEYAKRVGVAGYGSTRLKNVDNPLSPENRRIEVRILWNGKKE